MANIYCRVSAGSSCSLDYQESVIRNVCEKLNWPVSNVYKCVSSAYKKPATYLQALSEIKNGKFVFYAVDRFSRDVSIGTAIAKRFLKNKSMLYFVREKLMLDNSNFSLFTKYLEHAEQESRNIADRTSTAKRYLSDNGYCVSAVAPFGYKKRKLSNGHYKIEKNDTDIQIKNFIIACRTKGTTVLELNRLLRKCKSVETLELSEGDMIIEGLSYENISDLLNDFKLGNRTWTSNVISSICRKTNVV